MYLLRSLKSRMKGTRIIPFSIAADGTSSNPAITTSKTATGKYSITFKRAFQEKPFVLVQAVTASNRRVAQVDAALQLLGSVGYEVRDDGGTLTDTAANGFIIGSEGLSPRYVNRWTTYPANIHTILSRFMFFEFNGTTEVQTTGYTFDGTITRTGTGLFTLTLARRASDSVICLAQSTVGNQKCEVATTSVTGATIEVRDNGGTLVNGQFSLLVLAIDKQCSSPRETRRAKISGAGAVMFPYESDATQITRNTINNTFTDNGVGDYTVGFSDSYSKAGFGFSTVINDNATVVRVGMASRSTTGINVVSSGDATLNGICVGYLKP